MAFDERSNDLDNVLDDLSEIDVQELTVRGASLGDSADNATKDSADNVDDAAQKCPADAADDSVEPVASVISVVALTWAT